MEPTSVNDIAMEINAVNKKIKKSESNIKSYKEKINSAEEFYKSLNSFKNKFTETIDNHHKQVYKYSKMLDKDSTFGNYFALEINKILYGTDNLQINELVSNSKTRIIQLINEYEEKIRCEETNIYLYKQKLKDLKSIMNAFNL